MKLFSFLFFFISICSDARFFAAGILEYDIRGYYGFGWSVGSDGSVSFWARRSDNYGVFFFFVFECSGSDWLHG